MCWSYWRNDLRAFKHIASTKIQNNIQKQNTTVIKIINTHKMSANKNNLNEKILKNFYVFHSYYVKQ